MAGTLPEKSTTRLLGRRRLCAALCFAVAAAALSACAGGNSEFFSNTPPPSAEAPPEATIGTGSIRVALILPLSAQGNAGVAAQSMKNAAEMAIAEFKNPDIQLLVKDDGGTPQGAQTAGQNPHLVRHSRHVRSQATDMCQS